MVFHQVFTIPWYLEVWKILNHLIFISSKKNSFEIPPCAKLFSDTLISFIKGMIFAQNYKFSKKNYLLCAWRNFKKNDKWNFKPKYYPEHNSTKYVTFIEKWPQIWPTCFKKNQEKKLHCLSTCTWQMSAQALKFIFQTSCQLWNHSTTTWTSEWPNT